MFMEDFLKNPTHWLKRAEATRAKAEDIWADDAQKRRLLRVAEEYERLAERAAQRQTLADPQEPFTTVGSR
jgi:hypothetical protein